MQNKPLAPVPPAGPPCERTSAVAAANLAFSEWPSVFGDGKTAAALLDRPAHHCGTVETAERELALPAALERPIRPASRAAAQIWKMAHTFKSANALQPQDVAYEG